MKIEQAINQKKFKSEYQKAHINLAFTASWLNMHTNEALKAYGISPQQFNVLRILKGLSPESATVKLLMERMIDRMSNASRLVEKLKDKGLVLRIPCSEDRRKVHITITPKGIKLVDQASVAIAEVTRECFKSLGPKRAKALNALLDDLRG